MPDNLDDAYKGLINVLYKWGFHVFLFIITAIMVPLGVAGVMHVSTLLEDHTSTLSTVVANQNATQAIVVANQAAAYKSIEEIKNQVNNLSGKVDSVITTQSTLQTSVGKLEQHAADAVETAKQAANTAAETADTVAETAAAAAAAAAATARPIIRPSVIIQRPIIRQQSSDGNNPLGNILNAITHTPQSIRRRGTSQHRVK